MRTATVGSSLLLATLAFLTLVGCASADDPRAAASSEWLKAVTARDAAAAFLLLDPSAVAEVETLRALVDETRTVIAKSVPPAQRSAVLAASGLDGIPTTTTQDLFAHLFTAAASPVTLSGMQDIALRPRALNGEQVVTLGGDKIDLVEVGSGTWKVKLGGEDTSRLALLISNTRQNLERIKSATDKLGARRYGASAGGTTPSPGK
ncbi:MAG: hypothetical protein IV100_04180 [Myxococcales bacterium]|nr:hypothetical protein [Myxococcales bacterium]